VPELPDITVYVEGIRNLACSQPLLALRVKSLFFLRSVDPPPDAFVGRRLEGVHRVGKRIAMEFEGDLYAVIHLMIAGRLHWTPGDDRLVGSNQTADASTGHASAQGSSRFPANGIAAFDFPNGTLFVTEAGTKHRASLHLVHGTGALTAFDRGGVSVFDDTPEAFASALRRENRTVKRALTDPAIVDGIGNAYSDEILHRARMSPYAQTRSLDDTEIERLRSAAVEVLGEWIDRLRKEAGPALPAKVIAFHKEMAVHGKYGKPCPVCGTPVQRLVYAENEANYCPTCQTGGKVLADRALSRLLKDDWPRTLDELEQLKKR
jgi:formamidopyrimidine-DNA glycosylase